MCNFSMNKLIQIFVIFTTIYNGNDTLNTRSDIRTAVQTEIRNTIWLYKI